MRKCSSQTPVPEESVLGICQISRKSQPPSLLQENASWQDMSSRVDEMFEMLRGIDLLLRSQQEQISESAARYERHDVEFRQWTTEQAAKQDRRWQDAVKKVMLANASLSQGSFSPSANIKHTNSAMKEDSHGLSPSGVTVDASPSKHASVTVDDSLSKSTSSHDTRPLALGKIPKYASSPEQVQKREVQKKNLARAPSALISKTLMQRAMADASYLRTVVNGTMFSGISGIMILLNAVSIGIQTEWSAAHIGEKPPAAYRVIDVIFCVFFSLELLVRIIAERMHFIWSTEWRWNVFDVIVVTVSIVEEIFILLGDSGSALGNLTFLRVLRLLRLARVLRVIRVVRFFRELRLLVYSVLGSVKSLMWTMCLILLMLYIIGVFFTQFVIDHLSETRQQLIDDPWEEELVSTYGTLFRSVYSLYKGMTGGMDWGDGAAPLVEGISPWFAVLYSMYIAFALFAMLNVVTGIFVEHAMKDAQQDRDFVIQETMQDKQMKIEELERLFIEADQNGNGFLTSTELEEHFNDERVAAFLEALELDISSTRSLFHLLDSDKSGCVGIEEFSEGCRRLKGNVSSFDFALGQLELRRDMKHISDQLGRLTNQCLNALQGDFEAGEATPRPATSSSSVGLPSIASAKIMGSVLSYSSRDEAKPNQPRIPIAQNDTPCISLDPPSS